MHAHPTVTRRLSAWLLSGLALGGVLLGATEVLSRPRDASTLLERVASLEAEVTELRERVAELERVTVGKPKTPPSAHHVVAFPSTPDEQDEDCSEPLLTDAVGTKLLKESCAEGYKGSACDPLWSIDVYGVRSLRAGCEMPSAASCTVPFVVDPWGRQVVRPGCVDVGY